MSQSQVHRSAPGAVRGEIAILGLLALIYTAVRACDDDMVAKLDRVLRDVEAMVVAANGLPGASTSVPR